jgi:hypothetical protein
MLYSIMFFYVECVKCIDSSAGDTTDCGDISLPYKTLSYAFTESIFIYVDGNHSISQTTINRANIYVQAQNRWSGSISGNGFIEWK